MLKLVKKSLSVAKIDHEMFHALPEAPPREAIVSSSAGRNTDAVICDMKSLTRCRQPATTASGRGVAVGLRWHDRRGVTLGAVGAGSLGTAATAASISAYARLLGDSGGTTLRLFVSAGLFLGFAARAGK